MFILDLKVEPSKEVKQTKDLKQPKNVQQHKNLINTACDFDYIGERITFKFMSTLVSFRPKSIKVNFRKQSLTAMNFTQNQLSFKPNEVFTFTASFAKVPIDFFGFSADRIFTIVLEFEWSKSNLKLYQESFYIKLPVVKQTELSFKAPGTTYPNAITRCTCQQAFKMNETNSNDEIEQCIILEEFKLMSAVERYRIYGYIDMLGLFLDIENSFELDLLQKFHLNNVQLIRQGAIKYRINVS